MPDNQTPVQLTDGEHSSFPAGKAEANLTNGFWQFDTDHWFGVLHSSVNGLTQKAADDILSQAGRKKKTKSNFAKDMSLFLSQYKSPLMLMLIGAVILSAVLGDTSDVFIILFIVLSTGTLSFFQERNAGKVVEKLQSMLSLKSLVMRDGVAKDIDAHDIVPGDVILFKAGDMITADSLIIESNELHANEASITGEPYPVRKATGAVAANAELSVRSNSLWEGASIVSGTGKALVIATGEQTIFGNIARSAAATTETAFEKGIREFGYFLMKITLALSAFILTVNLLSHKGVMDSALFALALAVGMAPELLPAITTIAMSAGARRMLQKKVIVKKLSSIQNLGEVNLLCTDKTGTITEGVISVSGVVDISGASNNYVKKLACWNAQFESGYANPIDDALRKVPVLDAPAPLKKGEIPYDFTRKRISVLVDTGTERLLISKGAYQQIIGCCKSVLMTDGSIVDIAPQRATLDSQFAKYGDDGFRTIGVCYKTVQQEAVTKEDEAGMIFAGFILLQDPIKSGIIDAINALAKLSVGLKIITGDNRNIAVSIGKSIGIAAPVILSGPELAAISPEDLAARAKDTHIFAEIEPQQKALIIQALRKSYTVAYIGDGINDVPAINAADVGISVDNAVDIAKEAADFVLLEKDLMVLTDGIQEGRKTFSNTLKYIFINTGSTFGNMFSVAGASLMLPFLPMLPKQILLTNFITDFPYLAVASDNVDEDQLQRPGKWDIKFIRNFMVIFGIHSSLFDILTFATLYFVLKVKQSTFQTGWFVESVLTELFILFIVRTRKNFFKSVPGKYLFLLSVLGLVITLSLPYMPFAGLVGLVPLPPAILGVMLLIVSGYIVTADLLKVWFFRKYRN